MEHSQQKVAHGRTGRGDFERLHLYAVETLQARRFGGRVGDDSLNADGLIIQHSQQPESRTARIRRDCCVHTARKIEAPQLLFRLEQQRVLRHRQEFGR